MPSNKNTPEADPAPDTNDVAEPKEAPAAAEPTQAAAEPAQAVAEPTPAVVEPTPAAAASEPGLVVVTIDAGAGTIVRVEAVDARGARHDLSPAEAAQLLSGEHVGTLESLLQQAFEAGIACVLGDASDDAAEDEDEDETDEDAVVHDVLLESLMEHSPASRLMRRETLNRAMLGTIVAEAAGAAGPASAH